MRTISGQIEIARPIEEVFDVVADETNEPRYNDDMVRCDKITPGPIGVGTRYQAALKSTGAVPMTVEVTGFERPRRLESRANIEGTMDIRGAVTFEAIPAGTLMSWEWDVEPHGCMRLLGPFVARLGRRNEERIWAGLKKLLETRCDAVSTIHRRPDAPVPAGLHSTAVDLDIRGWRSVPMVTAGEGLSARRYRDR